MYYPNKTSWLIICPDYFTLMRMVQADSSNQKDWNESYLKILCYLWSIPLCFLNTLLWLFVCLEFWLKLRVAGTIKQPKDLKWTQAEKYLCNTLFKIKAFLPPSLISLMVGTLLHVHRDHLFNSFDLSISSWVILHLSGVPENITMSKWIWV